MINYNSLNNNKCDDIANVYNASFISEMNCMLILLKLKKKKEREKKINKLKDFYICTEMA